MGRTLYLVLVAPLLVLVFILPELSASWNEQIRFATMIAAAIAVWLCVFLRFSQIGVRRELSVLPALPFLYFPIYHMWLGPAANVGKPGVLAVLMLGIAFIAGGISMVMSYVPDKWEQGTRRMDPMSIMLSVFTTYFVLTECWALAGQLFV